MKVLITGGCGFIGFYATEKFSREGHLVYIIDNRANSMRTALPSNYIFYNLDVADKNCEEIFRINKFDVVVHLAAYSEESCAEDDTFFCSDTNILGLINILKLSRKYQVKKFIYASSYAVYGNQETYPVPETAPLMPVSPLGIDKLIGECYCQRWAQLHGTDLTILRFASVYGKSNARHGQLGNICDLMQKMVSQKSVVLHGEKDQTMDYIHVSEAAHIIFLAAVKNTAAKVINVSANTELSFKKLTEKLAVFKPIKVTRYEKSREKTVGRVSLDNTVLKEQLQWESEQSFDESLAATYEWYKKNYINPNDAKEKSTFRKFLETKQAYLKNAAVFAFLCFLYFQFDFSYVNSILGMDYNYLYIALMGFLYGKKQSLFSVLLAACLFTKIYLDYSPDWFVLLDQKQYLFHLAAYLCTGIITGFAIDYKDRLIDDLTQETAALKEKHEFLDRVHSEANQS